jgi:hypothetical protein
MEIYFDATVSKALRKNEEIGKLQLHCDSRR